jgi:hypothetical protein
VPFDHRSTTFRAAVALVGGFVAVAATAGCSTESGTSGEAACAAPTVEVEPRSVAPGDEIEITGRDFMDGCEDHPGAEDSTPMSGLTVRWLQGGVTADLGVVDANQEGTWTVIAPVPEDAVAGEARIDVAPSTGTSVVVTS